jgi:hypothetical protein
MPEVILSWEGVVKRFIQKLYDTKFSWPEKFAKYMYCNLELNFALD